MTTPTVPRIYTQRDVFIVELGTEYSHLYESLLDGLTILPLLAESVDQPRLVIDMKNVKFIGSAVIGHFVTVSKKLAERGGRLMLANTNQFCRAAVKLSNLDSMMPCVDSLDLAVQHGEEC